ncbi:TonB-dependent receptor [Gloeobacter violaceus]|nr:TonB-dependent receptor [Gloeobacter violaceus]
MEAADAAPLLIERKADLRPFRTEASALLGEHIAQGPPAEPDPTPQSAPTVEDDGSEADLEEVVVTATRTRERLSDVARTVYVVPRRTIEQQSILTGSVVDILGNTVPGFGPPKENRVGNTLRGRDPQVLIDGIPVISNYASFYELSYIAPIAIEQIEVVGGPTAIYGDGATGGTINILTRRSTEKPQATTRAGFDLGLSNTAGGAGKFVEQFFSSQAGPVDFTIAASYRGSGNFYDAAGNRTPSLSDTLDTKNAYSAYGRFGFKLTPEQKLQLVASYSADTRYVNSFASPAVNSCCGVQQSRAIARNVVLESGYGQPVLQNFLAALDYTHENLWGSKLFAQVSYRDAFEVGIPYDFRFTPDGSGGIFDSFLRFLKGSEQVTTARAQVETPLADNLKILWGTDFKNDPVGAGIFELFDSKVFDESNQSILRTSGLVTIAPAYRVASLGAFLQTQWNISEQWVASGGLRFENVTIEAKDFFSEFAGGLVRGGSLDDSATVFNLGIVYKPTTETSIYANFAQGFSVPNFGSALFGVPSGFVLSDSLRALQPQIVDNYEIGFRGRWRSVQATLAAFFNYSALGTSTVQTGATTYENSRSPQRNYGVEATLDYQPAPGWRLGTLFGWSEGEQDFFGDGNFYPLNSFAVPPLKATAYIEHQTAPGWSNRLQLLYSGNRDRAYNALVDGFRVEGAPIYDYATVDYIGNIKFGSGTLEVGIKNLLNNLYSPVYSQAYSSFGFGPTDRFNVAARGVTLNVAYTIDY